MRSKKMLEGFHTEEEECSMCRILTDLVCAHMNTAPGLEATTVDIQA